jgi:uncharacterized repeat protein (TIGR03803 family)
MKQIAQFAIAAALAISAQAQSYSVVTTFNPTTGVPSQGARLALVNGVLYATTFSGGAYNNGVVLQIAGDVASPLYNFTGTIPETEFPTGVIADSAGNLYGTTEEGGSANAGTIYKLDTSGTFTVLYSFSGPDGQLPWGLVRDPSGALYGTTVTGGSAGCCGVAYKLDQFGTFTVLHQFTGTVDGVGGGGPLVYQNGQLYGVTPSGGASGRGYIYAINSTTGAKTVLHTFAGNYGSHPSPLISDGGTNLYGTASVQAPYGNVYRLSLGTRKLTTLASFTGPNGSLPEGGLARDSTGNLYGTTSKGGLYGFGTVYSLSPTGTLTTLYNFAGGSADGNPSAGLVRDATTGTLYGIAADTAGSADLGEVFAVTP